MSWGAPQQGYQQPPTGYGASPGGQYGYQGGPQQAGYRPPPPQYGSYQAAGGQYGAPSQNQACYQGGYQAPPQYGSPQGYPGGPVGYAPAPPAGVSQELWGWFQAVDADRSGRITVHELQQALHNGNWTPFNPETCRLMISMFDRDRNGTIDIQEFAALWKYIQDWKTCFDRFDTDRSGNISANELYNAFRTYGYNLSMNFVHVCMRTYDRHQRGVINFDDFIQCCILLKSLTDQFRIKDTQQNGMIRIQYEEFLRMVLDSS